MSAKNLYTSPCDTSLVEYVVRTRIVWVKPLGYEVNIDETNDIIEALINEPFDSKAPYFGTYDEAKDRIDLEIKLP